MPAEGSDTHLGARCREFESPHSDQTMIIRTTLSKWVMCSDLSFLLRIYYNEKGGNYKLPPFYYVIDLSYINQSDCIVTITCNAKGRIFNYTAKCIFSRELGLNEKIANFNPLCISRICQYLIYLVTVIFRCNISICCFNMFIGLFVIEIADNQFF